MRKLTAITFALLITTSAFATPPNDSSDRSRPGVLTRIVRQIKNIIHALDDGGPIAPIPAVPTTNP